ncbi:nucleolar protein 12 [Nannizzia gypsea CBS 118893]|uniref:Nucleolar protein 12 n=1 Tax=Arthroderma gypseum (strain ATCC MYA-4604 / CBS 118893) TaxID=535722 RepID=E4UYA8_ARTGP|nr:nucleolar protein 12 [Nannizzia gypsea CBS 118893]EFR02071.1 nucleolar protein 12 [Nannizzia gypsea CBS 118893]
MGKKAKAQSAEGAPAIAAASTATGGFPLATTKVDPGLAALFAQSAGPVKEPELKPVSRRLEKEADDDEEEDIGEGEEDEEVDDEDEDEEEEDDDDVEMEDVEEKSSRKRKRGAENDDLEAAYLDRLSREDDRERKKEAEKTKRVKTAGEDEGDEDDDEEDDDEEREEDKIPMHESVSKSSKSDPMDKPSRTLFLSNVSTEAIKSKSAKKTLLNHLSSLLPKPSSTDTPSPIHKIESLRFRSTAFSSTALPRRAAYAKKELMDSTTKGTNVYVVYSTVLAAKKALKLNGTMVLDRHIRVDSVSKPSPTDHTRCVFVGNLGFVDEETQPAPDEGDGEVKKKAKKGSEAGDVEEGLWRTFNERCGGEGVVESVRVVRDRLTRVGKGFAYVQFKDENCVEAALLLDGKKFPPMLPRKLRVTRAKKVAVGSEGVREGVAKQREKGGKGRKDEKLFGRAVAAGLKSEEREKQRQKQKQKSGRGWGKDANAVPLGSKGGNGSGTTLVFEGYRAKDGNKPAFKMKKSKGGKPKTRSSRRASAYKSRNK